MTNDDGIDAKGIYKLAEALSKEHEIIVVAPRNQRSACSHSITIEDVINIREESLENLNVKAYSLSGTPADCVRLGLNKICDGKIDMVISGINRGLNAGTDVIYSGTVSAAIEAVICKIPSIAVSQEISQDMENYDRACEYVLKVLDIAKEKYMKDDVVLNLNIPINDIKGFKVAKIGKTTYTNKYEKVPNEEFEESYRITGTMDKRRDVDDDVYYLRQGYVTLTPLHYDLTNFKILKDVGDVFKV